MVHRFYPESPPANPRRRWVLLALAALLALLAAPFVERVAKIFW